MANLRYLVLTKKCSICFHLWEKNNLRNQLPQILGLPSGTFGTCLFCWPLNRHPLHRNNVGLNKPINQNWVSVYNQPSFATQQQVPRLQGCNVIRHGSKVLQGSKIPQLQVSRIARLQSTSSMIQQRNDQRNAKQTQNTIELLKSI